MTRLEATAAAAADEAAIEEEVVAVFLLAGDTDNKEGQRRRLQQREVKAVGFGEGCGSGRAWLGGSSNNVPLCFNAAVEEAAQDGRYDDDGDYDDIDDGGGDDDDDERSDREITTGTSWIATLIPIDRTLGFYHEGVRWTG
ncbi:hypothetical protein GW17_00057896 [Ensete ventricosum]|nr:hypothetical protein GW17_00057896 [Ensete ventricosum]